MDTGPISLKDLCLRVLVKNRVRKPYETTIDEFPTCNRCGTFFDPEEIMNLTSKNSKLTSYIRFHGIYCEMCMNSIILMTQVLQLADGYGKIRLNGEDNFEFGSGWNGLVRWPEFGNDRVKWIIKQYDDSVHCSLCGPQKNLKPDNIYDLSHGHYIYSFAAKLLGHFLISPFRLQYST